MTHAFRERVPAKPAECHSGDDVLQLLAILRQIPHVDLRICVAEYLADVARENFGIAVEGCAPQGGPNAS